MALCPVCQHEIDEAAKASGRCAGCGARLLQLPQRTIQDTRFIPQEPEENPSHATTVDITPIDLTKTPDAETLAMYELSQGAAADAEENALPSTVTFGEDVTMEWGAGGQSTDPDATLLASQWREELERAKNDPNATIKLKDTVTGSYVTSSSLVVKSRHVRSTGETAFPITSPADAPDYELLNIIGEGGMGVVYAARQSSIARTVALKMLKSEEGKHAVHRDKFISEAVVTGELDHPNIVPIYDLGANDEGALFYSMKRVKGTPWNKVIKSKSLDENLNILLRVADAVAFAHVNGVIHRDLKPENVMLGDFGEVLVMDWGLARVSPEFPNAGSITQSDAMGGTPAYMAPEMATGPLEKITAASDIYLLGAILYEIIQKRPPHSGKTVMSCLFSAAKNDIPVPDKSHELLDIALKAMASQPEDRFPNVQAFQKAVREYQAHSESIKLVGHAANHLNKAAQEQDFDLYSRARFGLEEALALWPNNRRAATLLSKARVEYARLALDKGNYELGISLLDPEEDDHKPLLADLHRGRNEVESRQRRIKMLKGAVAALIVSIICIGGVSYVNIVRQKNRAVAAEALAKRNEQTANEQRGIALANEKTANEQRAIALANEKTANEQRAIALANEKTANEERARAVASEKVAQEQRQLAVEAREEQEYEAYIANIGLTQAKLEENAFDRAAELLEQSPSDRRNWEWGRLKYLTQLSEKTWDAGARVDSIAYSPDGRRFASGGSNQSVVIWNAQTGEREREIPVGRYVNAVAFDSIGERVAAGSSDGLIRVFRVADGQQLNELRGHSPEKGNVVSVRFSPDDRELASASFDETARVWNLETGESQVLEGHNWWVWSAEFSTDGNRLVTAGHDGQAVVWIRDNAQTPFRYDTAFPEHNGAVYAAKFAPDGLHVASAGYDGRVLLWDPTKVRPVDIKAIVEGRTSPPSPYREIGRHLGPVHALSFSLDGRNLATGGEDNLITLWSLNQEHPPKTLRGHGSHVQSCAFSPDGKLLLSAGRDDQIKLWRPESYAETVELAEAAEERQAVRAARFSADGKHVVTAGHDRTASLWDVSTKKRVQQFAEGHDFLASRAVFFANGTRLATAAGDGTVRIWDAATGAQLLSLEGTGASYALDVSSDDASIITGGDGNTAQIWNAQTGERVAELRGTHPQEITAVRFAPGGQLLATGDDAGRCRLWRYDAASKTWSPGAELLGHSRMISALAFTAEGARLVSASGDTSCGQWDVNSGEELQRLALDHPEWVSDLVVSADGQTALTACEDGLLRVWSLGDARLRRTIEWPTPNIAISSIDLSPDGRVVAAVSAAERTVRLFDANSGAEVHGGNAENGGAAAWLAMERGETWAARFSPQGDSLLVIGGNDARLIDLATRQLAVRFSPHGVVASVDISPHGDRVVTASWDGVAKIWDAKSGAVLLRLDGVHAGFVNSACFSPDGARVLTAGDDGVARLWQVSDGAPSEVKFEGHRGSIYQAAFSPDGKHVLTVSRDRTAKLFEAATGREVATLAEHKYPVRCGAFSGDGQLIITGSEDTTAIIWNLRGEKLYALPGHTAPITSVALSKSGNRALTGSVDNTVKLWDGQGKEILTLMGHTQPVTSVSFSPDGLSALTSGQDGLTLLWPALEWGQRTLQTASVSSGSSAGGQ